ncbi:hypothetical protein CVT26_004472 [Gymnopilus dilepis]|uniref:Uncharacterized protein n=1 Tax=Gymnopilus dilepis TaxID=231916 RepID=A0A409WDU2_9AGAR|nr:hypothetical protein CVT26_004472 [Gymnopilus dilepis]
MSHTTSNAATSNNQSSAQSNASAASSVNGHGPAQAVDGDLPPGEPMEGIVDLAREPLNYSERLPIHPDLLQHPSAEALMQPHFCMHVGHGSGIMNLAQLSMIPFHLSIDLKMRRYPTFWEAKGHYSTHFFTNSIRFSSVRGPPMIFQVIPIIDYPRSLQVLARPNPAIYPPFVGPYPAGPVPATVVPVPAAPVMPTIPLPPLSAPKITPAVLNSNASHFDPKPAPVIPSSVPGGTSSSVAKTSPIVPATSSSNVASTAVPTAPPVQPARPPTPMPRTPSAPGAASISAPLVPPGLGPPRHRAAAANSATGLKGGNGSSVDPIMVSSTTPTPVGPVEAATSALAPAKVAEPSRNKRPASPTPLGRVRAAPKSFSGVVTLSGILAANKRSLTAKKPLSNVVIDLSDSDGDGQPAQPSIQPMQTLVPQQPAPQPAPQPSRSTSARTRVTRSKAKARAEELADDVVRVTRKSNHSAPAQAGSSSAGAASGEASSSSAGATSGEASSSSAVGTSASASRGCVFSADGSFTDYDALASGNWIKSTRDYSHLPDISHLDRSLRPMSDAALAFRRMGGGGDQSSPSSSGTSSESSLSSSSSSSITVVLPAANVPPSTSAPVTASSAAPVTATPVTATPDPPVTPAASQTFPPAPSPTPAASSGAIPSSAPDPAGGGSPTLSEVNDAEQFYFVQEYPMEGVEEAMKQAGSG